MTKVSHAELAARLAPFLSGYIGPSTVIGSPYVAPPPPFGIRLVRGGTGLIEWFPATTEGFFNAVAVSADTDAILVPAGTYEFTETLVVDTNIAIIGENMQTCIIESNFNLLILRMWKGGSLQNFTFNTTYTGTGGGLVVYLYGDDESTDTFINVPYIENVTFNLTVTAPNINFAVIALFWYWEQDKSGLPLAGAKTFTAVKDVYINAIDNRVGISYGCDGFLAIYDANSGTMVADNVNVTIVAGFTNLLAIEMEPVYENKGRLEARNCSVDVRAVSYSTYGGTTGFYILWCNMYDCKVHVESLEEAEGIYFSGGHITIRDCEVYVEGTYAVGLQPGYPSGVDIINCQVEAVAI